MPYSSNALTTVSFPIQSAAVASTPALGRPDILTYTYASRMVYVIPGETYDVRSSPQLPLPVVFADPISSKLLI